MASDIEEHLQLFRLTTPEVLGIAAFGGDTDAASAALRKLVSRRSLVRGRGLYIAREIVSDEQAVQRAYAVFHYCCLQRPRRRLMRRHELEQVFAPLIENEQGTLPSSAACFLDREKRMSMLRVQPIPKSAHDNSVNLALHSLQQVVESEPFRLFAWFAQSERLSITYLMRDHAQATELRLWTKRRPLMTPLLATPVPVPLIVAVVPQLP